MLRNVDAWLVGLDDWPIVMGSMLGDAGFRFGVDAELVGQWAASTRTARTRWTGGVRKGSCETSVAASRCLAPKLFP